MAVSPPPEQDVGLIESLVPQAGVWWMGLGISLEADGRGAEARDALQRAKATGTLSPELAAFVEQKLRQLP